MGISALIAVTFAAKCNWDESKYEVVRRGTRSGDKDNDESEIDCPEYYQMVKCECSSYDNNPEGCDGSKFQIVKNTKDQCRAYNSKEGKGVQAVATCHRLVITCESEIADMPFVNCPNKFKLIGCNLHATHMHLNRPGNPNKPVSKRAKSKCYTTSGCSEQSQCRVEARCVRVEF